MTGSGRPRLLNLDPDRYSPAARAILDEVAEVVDGPLARTELEDRIGAFDALILRFSHRIDRDLIRRAPRLRLIATNATGTDHIDEVAAREHGISVISLRGETAFLETIPSTAELTWGLLLALTRRIPAAAADVVAGQWRRDLFTGRDLAGRRLGIIGCGRIGRKVARYGLAFGMTVAAFDREPIQIPGEVAAFADLGELFATSDVVSIHLPYTAETRHLIGGTLLARLPAGAVLINTARGAIVEEHALFSALTTGRLAGAALDVLDGETDAGFANTHPLIHYAATHSNLLITPHIGGASADSWRKTEEFIARRVHRVLG